MVLSALLQTKLTPPPVRTNRVHRPRLTQRFSASLERRLTLVCAPAGYGKSTLLGEWFGSEAGMPIPFGWLSLDEDDNDPVRFLAYLISAFDNASGIDTGELLSLLYSPQPPPPKAVLTALISSLEDSPQQFALVLDDYHRVTAQPVHEAMIYLLDHLPSWICLVVISREDPPFPLARLRGRGQLVEMRADDLRFTPEEAGQFLEQMLGTELSADQIKNLDARTEGWIAGLQLAGLAMKGRENLNGFISAFTGSHRFILDYLSEEVLSRQPENIQSFLLQTSILNRLSGPLCDAVTGRADGQIMLEQIEHGNMFLIPLDDERFWYRYHHLFGDMLRRQLQRTNPGVVIELHRRASMWFEQNGWVLEAVEHAFDAQDGENAARLVQHYSEHLWMRGELPTVMRWMRALPKEAFLLRPKLGLSYAFMLTMTDQYSEAELLVAEIEESLTAVPHLGDESGHKALLGQAAAIRATSSLLLGYTGDTTISAGTTALAYLPESALRWRAWANAIVGIACFVSKGQMEPAEYHLVEAIHLSEQINDSVTLMVGFSQLSRLYRVWGRLDKAEAIVEQFIQKVQAPTAYAQGRLDRCQIRYERNQIQAAFQDISEAHHLFEDYLLKRFAIDSRVQMARLHHLMGNDIKASDLMEQAVQIAQAARLTQTFVYESAWQAWLWLKQGKHAAAAQWVQSLEPTFEGELNPALEFQHIMVARILIAQEHLDDAQKLLTKLYTAAISAGRAGRVIPICILQAVTISLQGDTDKALKSLTEALTLGEAEGYVRVFVDEGAPIATLLRKAQARGISADYTAKLLAAFEPEVVLNTRPVQSPVSEIEPLSQRELEVLRRMADGASNREIAEALFVSIGTVKKHLSNIFLKLDAHSRTQAIANAQKHHLL